MTRAYIAERVWHLKRRDEVESTMEEAARLARDGAASGTVVVANHQTAGRGQRGHTWVERPGTCLLTTILFRPRLAVAVAPDLSRSIAQCVAAALKRVAAIDATVKDPNDVLVHGRKICGILSQSSIRGDYLDYLLVGVGLNVNVEESELPLPIATSLLVETGRRFDRDVVLYAVLDELVAIPGLCDGMSTSS